MSAPVIAKLSATSNLPNGIESVDINIGINQAPSATLHLGTQSGKVVVEPLASDILATIKEKQQKRLAGVTETDITLHVDDAIYGTIDMTGYTAAPMLEISEARIGYQIAVLDQVSLLDGLDLSIYQNVVGMLRKAQTKSDIPKPKGGNVTKLLLELTDTLVKNYDGALLEEKDPVKRQIMQMRHELNKASGGPLEIWRWILRKSRVVHESWAAMTNMNGIAGETISKQTLSILTMQSSGFWNVMNRLMSTFQMFYRPEPGAIGSYGRFVNNKDKIDEVDGELTLDISNLNVRDGSARILQVGGVTMEIGSAPGLRNPQIPRTAPSIAGLYPDPIKPGYIHQEITPIWLVSAAGAPVLGSEVDKSKDTPPGEVKPNLDLTAYPARREGGVKHLEKFEGARSAVLSEMCELTFKELQLADSTISARVPLNVTITVGKRQTLKLGDSGSVTGFVAGVSHRIDLRQGKELDSFSQVNITHVEY